jgi:DNA-binding CsgD family transcriptional regulator/sugar-specific transcriptional regulator TrmB
VDVSLRVLLAAGLVQTDPLDPALVTALDPELVSAVLTRSLRESIRQQQDRLHRIEEDYGRLRGYFLDARASSGNAVQLIPRLEEVRAALDQASEQCREELVCSQPGGGRPAEVLEEAWARDTALLTRGVRMRTLYHHTARFNAPSQAYVARATRLGAEYRTAHELFGRLIVFDRKVAFVPNEDSEWGAVVIREPALVGYLCSIFDQAWLSAEPFSDAAADGLQTVAKQLDQTILRLLAAGLKDEAIARRTGMSLRTARKHIADIMNELGADSRFQAGVLAARTDLLDGSCPPGDDDGGGGCGEAGGGGGQRAGRGMADAG